MRSNESKTGDVVRSDGSVGADAWLVRSDEVFGVTV